MNIVDAELEEIQKTGQHVVPKSRLVSCVRTMVRTEIKYSTFKTIVVCLQFPQDYPNSILLIELKSKTISDKLLMKLTNICDQEAKKLIGKPQVLHVLKFVSNFVSETPLCCCYDEINNLKKLLTSEFDEIKLKQRTSSILFKIVGEKYFIKLRIVIPDLYPEEAVTFKDIEDNFPPFFSRHMVSQSKEINRKCVEPPLTKRKDINAPAFKPSPSIEKIVRFLIDFVKRVPTEKCQICKESCLPEDPNEVIINEKSPKHIEWVYCGHLFHNECLISYMRKPPFGNKTCPTCKRKIYHEKWNLSDRLAEDRWVHEQARERELAEVTEFFQ